MLTNKYKLFIVKPRFLHFCIFVCALFINFSAHSKPKTLTCKEKYEDALDVLNLYVASGVITSPESIQRIQAKYLALYIDCKKIERAE